MSRLKNPSIGVAVITHKAKHHLTRCLPPLLKSPLKPRVVVVNSSSNDGTVELAQQLGAETLVIPRDEFNHGLTRERARKHLKTDIVVMVTPDAYAIDAEALEILVEPIILGRAVVAYGRQLPHNGATLFEAFPREFNYPNKSHTRGLDSYETYGIYTYFCSDSFAAYLNSALDEVNGFPEVLTGEDTVVVAKLLHKGHRIAYVAEACVQHSHDYTLWQEFQRHFDTGLARSGYQNLIPSKGGDESRGKEYVKQLLKKVITKHPYLLPYALMQIGVKYAGYRIGRASLNAPLSWKKALSGQDFYWMNKK